MAQSPRSIYQAYPGDSRNSRKFTRFTIAFQTILHTVSTVVDGAMKNYHAAQHCKEPSEEI